jgi:SAM-dependent methyltransferase
LKAKTYFFHDRRIETFADAAACPPLWRRFCPGKAGFRADGVKMNKNLHTIYNENFYHRQVDGSVRSAAIVLDILYKIYQPRSVVEFGCGLGGWLAAAESYGAKILKGYDGDWVDEEKLKSGTIDFTAVDFEKSISLAGKYDLAISLEVAEHLSSERAKAFVKTICNSSDVVLFGAAIPYQGGANHINEQWQSYWIELFSQEGYRCHDILRKQIWDDPSVGAWYRQNTFLFVRENSPLNMSEKLKGLDYSINNLVHPELYLSKSMQLEAYNNMVRKPTFKFFLKVLRRFFKSLFRSMLGIR